MNKHCLLVSALILTGCPSSNTRVDAGDPDAAIEMDDAGRDAGAIDIDAGPVWADVVVDGTVFSHEGATVRMRVIDSSIPAAGDWQTDTVIGGTFEITFERAMPRDVFGVFVEGWFDDGDEACDESEEPFRLFVSNDMTAGPILADHADAQLSTCLSVETDP